MPAAILCTWSGHSPTSARRVREQAGDRPNELQPTSSELCSASPRCSDSGFSLSSTPRGAPPASLDQSAREELRQLAAALRIQSCFRGSRVRRYIAIVRARQAMLAAVERVLHQGRSGDPEVTRTTLDLADALRAFGQWRRAEQCYVTALENAEREHGHGDPLYRRAARSLTRLYRARGEHDKAEQILRRRDPKVPLRDAFADAWENMAEALLHPPTIELPLPPLRMPSLELPSLDAGPLLPPGVDPVTFLRLHVEGGLHNFLAAMEHIRAHFPLRGVLLGQVAGGGAQRPPWTAWPPFMNAARAAQEHAASLRRQTALDEDSGSEGHSDDDAPPSAADLAAVEAGLVAAWRAAGRPPGGRSGPEATPEASPAHTSGPGAHVRGSGVHARRRRGVLDLAVRSRRVPA